MKTFENYIFGSQFVLNSAYFLASSGAKYRQTDSILYLDLLTKLQRCRRELSVLIDGNTVPLPAGRCSCDCCS